MTNSARANDGEFEVRPAEVVLVASIPGLPGGEIRVTVHNGQNAFIAARQFSERWHEQFGDVAAAEPAQRPAPPATSTAPICNVHNRPMKASAKPEGGWYCSAKLRDGTFCKERAGA